MADDRADALYGLPLEEFVPARAALAKALRQEKRRDDAAAVAALAKPSRPAWIVNQLARGEQALTAKLIECAEALAEAQQSAVSGQGARDLRAATRSERRAVEQLLAAARDLRPEGRPASPAILERVRTTLQAAAGDDALRERIRTGRVVEEPAAGGAWPGLGPAGDDEPPDAEAPGVERGSGDAAEQGSSHGDAGTGHGSRSRPERARRSRRGEDAGQRPGAPRRRGGGDARPARRSRDDEPAAGGGDGGAGGREQGGGAGERRRSERGGERPPPDAEDERATAAGAQEAAEADAAAAAEAAEAEAARRSELKEALTAARRAARDAARERERARRDAERAAERHERLAAEAAAAREAAEGAAARRAQTEAVADDAEAEVARLEAELRNG